MNADIIRITNTGITEFLGRSSADINEISTFFSSGNLHYNHIIFNSLFEFFNILRYCMVHSLLHICNNIIMQILWCLFISALYYDLITADQLLKEVTMMFS